MPALNYSIYSFYTFFAALCFFASVDASGFERAKADLSTEPVEVTEDEAFALELLELYQKSVQISMSVTVFPNGYSELIWYHDGVLYTAVSNMDFTRLAPIGDFQYAGTHYSVFYMLSVLDGKTLKTQNRLARKYGFEPIELPLRRKDLPRKKGSPDFVIVLEEGESEPPKEAIASIEALHRYCQYNEHKIAAALAQAEQRKLEHEQTKRLATQKSKPTQEELKVHFVRKHTPQAKLKFQSNNEN